MTNLYMFLRTAASSGKSMNHHDSTWAGRIKRAVISPHRSVARALNECRWQVRSAILNLFCDLLLRWGGKLGISGNFRARMFWKAGRRDIVPLAQLYDYMSQEKPDGQYYSRAPEWSCRGQTILNILSPLISKECSILEIGCNHGRCLNQLWQAGYKNLLGMEISKYAVGRMSNAYPWLANIGVDIGPAEQSIRKYPNSSIDVIFSVATLEHMHPDNKYMFKEMARVASKYVLAIEPRDGHRSHMQYPWNIKHEFMAVGLDLVDSRPWHVFWPRELSPENEWAEDMRAYDVFLFKAKRVV
jgi:SAM-dependent methyltransferase